LAELAPALYHNLSIKVLDMSKNNLIDTESASTLLDILRRNKTMSTIDLMNRLGQLNATDDEPFIFYLERWRCFVSGANAWLS
jgi:hypothetical protein